MTEHTATAYWIRYACDGCNREIPLLVPGDLADRILHSYPCYTCGSYTSHRKTDDGTKTVDHEPGTKD